MRNKKWTSSCWYFQSSLYCEIDQHNCILVLILAGCATIVSRFRLTRQVCFLWYFLISGLYHSYWLVVDLQSRLY